MASSTETTLIRAKVATAKRIDRMAARLEKTKGGSWSRASVIEAAIDCLEADAAKAQAQEHPTA